MILGWFGSHEDLIGGCLTLVAGLSGVFSEGLVKRKWFTRTVVAVTLIGGALTLHSSLDASKSQAANQDHFAAKQQTILDNASAINAQVSDASSKLKDLQQKLGDENKAVSDLTDDVKSGTRTVLGATTKVENAFTGGDNYIYVDLAPETLDGKPNVLRIYLVNPGLTPVYDVNYSVMKAPSAQSSAAEIMESIRTAMSGYVPIVPAGDAKWPIMIPSHFETAPGEYMVHVYMRNGRIEERSRVVKNGARWDGALVVKRNGKTLQSKNPQELTAPF